MLLLILVVFLALAVAGGGYSYPRYGYAGWSPLGVVLLVLVVLWFTGHIRV